MTCSDEGKEECVGETRVPTQEYIDGVAVRVLDNIVDQVQDLAISDTGSHSGAQSDGAHNMTGDNHDRGSREFGGARQRVPESARKFSHYRYPRF